MRAAGTDSEVEGILASLRARLPALPDIPADGLDDESLGELKRLIRDAGRALRRLRGRPRSETAPLARFREACREALSGGRALRRGRRKIDAARRRLAQPGS